MKKENHHQHDHHIPTFACHRHSPVHRSFQSEPNQTTASLRRVQSLPTTASQLTVNTRTGKSLFWFLPQQKCSHSTTTSRYHGWATNPLSFPRRRYHSKISGGGGGGRGGGGGGGGADSSESSSFASDTVESMWLLTGTEDSSENADWIDWLSDDDHESCLRGLDFLEDDC